jgi:hypothetical protein
MGYIVPKEQFQFASFFDWFKSQIEEELKKPRVFGDLLIFQVQLPIEDGATKVFSPCRLEDVMGIAFPGWKITIGGKSLSLLTVSMGKKYLFKGCISQEEKEIGDEETKRSDS